MMGRMRKLLVLLVLAVAVPAQAGRSRFGWLYDSETLPVRAVELENWVQEEDGKAGEDETLIWWAPVVGLSNRIELAIPIELSLTETATTSSARIERYGAEVRWRLNEPDPVEAGPFGALLRFAVKRQAAEHDTVRLEGDAVVTVDDGPLRVAIDMGAVVEATKHDSALELKPGAGVSLRVAGELRLGAEGLAELHPGENNEVNWVAVGPNLAFVHGRFWLSAAFLIGVKDIDYVPRLNWAIQF
jgi:hypothetical protein